ncbi:MAG: cyclic nucleotide-binding domain-containing protein [Verrucomicrobiota bacterium]
MREFAYIHESEEALPPTLAGIPFLKMFDARELNYLLRECLIVECEVGDPIITEGMTDSRIYLLLSGELEILKGSEQLAKIDTPGSIFGEMAIMGDQLRTATVRATGKVFCLAIDLKALHERMPMSEHSHYYAQLYGFISKILAERLHHTSQELAQLKEANGV